MLRRVNLSPQLLDQPDHPIPLAALSALMEQSAERSGQSQFGLMLCEARTLGSLGPLAVLLAQDTTCREVIEHIIRFQRLIGEAAMYSLEPEGELSIFRTELDGSTVGPQLREYQMGLMCRLLRDWLRLPWAPERAHFAHSAPADLRLHARIFRCPLEFESPFNGFICSPSTLEGVRSGGDPELAGEAFRMVDHLMAESGDHGVEARARRSIRLILPMGGATLDRVAWSLGVNPRKLQRLLEDVGKNFRDLLNDVRCEMASELLASPHHSIKSVALMTGFANPTAFTRWFGDQFGQSPSAWRSGAMLTVATTGLGEADTPDLGNAATGLSPPPPALSAPPIVER